ncbi:MAG: serine protease [Syntrophobacteraceae bacterium]
MKKNVLFLALLATILLPGPTTPVSAADPETLVSSPVTLSTPSGATSYWTPERIQNAKPYPLPMLNGLPPSLSSTTPQRAPQGAPGFVPGQAPQGSALMRGDEGLLRTLAGGAQDSEPSSSEEVIENLAAGYDYPPPHTTFFVYSTLYGSRRGIYPHNAIGRVFFTGSDGLDYACSGASIGGRAVLTAGHCVHEGNGSGSGWHRNWVFVPGYKNTRVSVANAWAADVLWSTTGWYFNGDLGLDLGAAVTVDKRRRTLSATVGSLGLAYNLSETQHWSTFGYPAQDPYDGKWLVQTNASFSRADTTYTPNPVGIGTTLNAGASGGPRVINFAPGVVTGSNYLNGVNSYRYLPQPNEVFSPYFGSAAYNLYCGVTGLCTP